VVVLDKRFIPERVAGLPKHFSVYHADMADLDLVRHLARDADVVQMLAAEVEAESSGDRSDEVWRVNFELPKSVIEAVPSTARVQFASTCNVFGGLPEGAKWEALTEDDEPAPKLPYAEAKRAMEVYLGKSNRNHTIVRFGTNYGFAPGARFNLVTNHFVKSALEGRELKLFGGGTNWRPTACVWDCARALDFLAPRRDAAREIFHVVCRAYQIRDLAAEIVRVVGNPAARVVNIDRPVAFNSYAPAADKIKALGFTFEWPLQRAVADMAGRLAALRSPLVAAGQEVA
jgi:nucleoside-diphosphate-sugar epimerase